MDLQRVIHHASQTRICLPKSLDDIADKGTVFHLRQHQRLLLSRWYILKNDCKIILFVAQAPALLEESA
jgi:hypothetical protein